MAKSKKSPENTGETSTEIEAGPSTTPMETLESEAVVSRIVMAATNAGQVGKSYVIQNLVQWVKNHPCQPGFRAFDLDTSVKATLSQVHKDDARIEKIDLSEDASLDRVVQVLMQDDVDLSIVDGRGGHHDVVMKWARDTDLFQLSVDAGFRFTLVLVLANTEALVRESVALMEEVGDNADWLVVRNLKNNLRFPLWDAHGAPIAKQLGAREIEIRALGATMAQQYDAMLRPFPEMQQWAHTAQQDMLKAVRWGTEWKRIKEAFDSVQDILLPSDCLSKLGG